MTDAAQESLVALPSPVLARGVSLPHPLSPPTSSDARTAVTNMDSQPSGIAETPLPDPKIFFHEDNHTSYDIWVHPNLPNRTFVVESIKAHGGQIVEHVAEAFFAIIHTDMTPGDYPELCNDEQGTVGISSEWVLNSVRAQCVQDPEDYVLWKPEEEEEQNEQSDGGQEAKNWDWEDVDVEAPALEDLLSLPSRPEISNLPPSPATKSLDEKFFLWIVPRFFAPRPAAPWIDLYRWLGANIPHRSENYWTNLNHKGSEVRRRANALLPLIPPRPGSTTRGAKRKSNPPKSGHADESSKATRRYADSENEAMIRHIASHPQLDGKALWSAFSGKHCERSSQAYNQHHDRHREYFNAAVTRFLRGENPPFQPPEASSCQASDIDPPETVVTRHGRRPKYTPEEHRAMKEFYAKHRHKYSKDFHVWLAFEKLQNRSAFSLHTYFLRHPDIGHGVDRASPEARPSFRATTHDPPSGNLSRPTLRPNRRFTAAEDDLLIQFARQRGYPLYIPMQEWEKLSEKNPSRSQWGWKTRYVNYIYPNRHDVDEEYSSTSSSSTSSHDRRKSSSSSSDANNNVTAAERALKRLRSNEKLDLPKKKHSRLDAPTSISVARRGTHTKKLTVVAPTMEMSSSSFTRADFVAAMNWVASRSRPNGIYQNLASWEQFAEQHPSHDAEEWVQFYYSERRLFKAIEERLGDISH